MATPAPSLKKFLADATARWPTRSRASDGIMGDPAHQARKSDHNLGNAADLTDDPANGVDCAVLSRQVISDPRVTYVIFNREIYRTYKPHLGWAAYTGSNPHRSHMHVSIKPEARNDLSPWPWSAEAVVKRGDRGLQVREIQLKLRIKADSVFGSQTESAVKEFQATHGLKADGMVGPLTRAALFEGEG